MEYVIDIDALLAPLGGDSACGTNVREDMSFDSPYQQLRDAREEAMSVEREDRSSQTDESQAGFSTDRTKWQVVVDTANAILQETSKDLEVCALLVEGLARTDGPAGLRDGFHVATELVRNYWEQLFPRIDPGDEDSLEDRVAAFAGLNGTGQQGPLVRYLGLMRVTGDGGNDFRCDQYNRAVEADRNPDPEERDRQCAAMGYSLEVIEKAAFNTPASFYVDMNRELGECREALQALDQAFIETCGYAAAPPSSMIAQSLETLADCIAFLGRDKIAEHSSLPDEEQAAEDAEQAANGDASPDKATSTGAKQGSGEISSREDAISRLRLVARYFREQEPHSPLSYSLDNLIRWSQLPLDRLLEEWIQDPEARNRYMLMTGIRMQTGDDGGEEY